MTASVRRALTRDEWVVLVLTSVLHLAAATWLATHDLIFPDAMSRVANGTEHEVLWVPGTDREKPASGRH